MARRAPALVAVIGLLMAGNVCAQQGPTTAPATAPSGVVLLEATFILSGPSFEKWLAADRNGSGLTWQTIGDAQVWGDFPDAQQVRGLLGRITGNPGIKTIEAPRMRLIDGEEAFVKTTSETAYIGSLTPIVGVGAVAADPQVETIDTGVTLNCRASFVDNKGSIQLAISATLTRLLEMLPVPLTIRSGEQHATAYYQVPVVSIARCATNLTLPAGRSAILRIVPQVNAADPNAPPQEPVYLLIQPKINNTETHP